VSSVDEQNTAKPMRARTLALTVAAGAAIAYLFDPQNGKRRRHTTRDRTLAFLRRRGRRSARLARHVAADAHGVSQKLAHLREEPKPQPDDVTLAHKVESEIFRDAAVPKGQINVNAERGVVVLRGEVEQPEMIDDLVEKTRKVQGVLDVRNLLHVPGQDAPARS
jgi:osmotically-inducible protein OsmY